MPKKGPSDYEIGYGKPPVNNQYKPGQSGNPSGRPAGRQNLTTRIGKKLAMRRSVIVSGNRVELPMDEILIERLVERAAKGNVKLILWLFEQMEKYRKSQERERVPAQPFLSSEEISKMSPQEQSDLYLRCVREAHKLTVEPPDTDEN